MHAGSWKREREQVSLGITKMCNHHYLTNVILQLLLLSWFYYYKCNIVYDDLCKGDNPPLQCDALKANLTSTNPGKSNCDPVNKMNCRMNDLVDPDIAHCRVVSAHRHLLMPKDEPFERMVEE